MMQFAVGAVIERFVFVNCAMPLEFNVTSPGASVVLTSTLPFTPRAPGWMWAMLITLVDGNPLMVTSNVAVAAVMLPDPSRVRLNVIVELPRALASAPAVGGTSLLASRFAVNIATFWLFEGPVVLSEPHAQKVA